MSQQQHDMYLDYAAPTNRSPSSSRAYAGGFQSGLSLPRQAQRPFDNALGSSALFPSDRLGYNPRAMDQMSANGMPGGYMLDNSQAWNYNAGGVATVNGAMNGANRQRSVNRRAALPTNWTDQGLSMHGSYGSSLNSGMSNGLRYDGQGDMRPSSQTEEQLIPTAIVIKNIPFAVRKETLAAVMMDMHLPQPYAFNYHFDNGVFRGLAFANFQSPEDTKIVIDAMNGMEVHGRKLRVEYKKMLPEAERERIEREKRERRGQLEEQHRAPMLHQQPSLQTLNSVSSNSNNARGALGDLNLNDPETLEYYTELTLFKRDPSREILIFPSTIAPEQRRQIHILAHNMGLEHSSVGEAESRQIHVVKRQLPSPTTQNHMPAVGLDYHKKGLSRAATFDFAADREARSASTNYSHAMGRQGPTLELPGSPDGTGLANLRAAKSFADLRSFSPSPSASSSSYLTAMNGIGNIPQSGASNARFGEYSTGVNQAGALATPNLTPTSGTVGTPGTDSSLLSSLGGLNLGSFESSAHNQARSTPGAIGSQRPGANGSSRNAPERQPRGPEWETSAGFTGRNRSNGHMQRGSDSSDNAPRAGSASRFH
ncbi:RNA-binding post-transcriptional regulator cip2 [Colletotrichum sidae]|uniref:RNA-binding post-transcriptional regulator cip2 n=3 Tax=Colletotrichum orbiculare species complex TaxID=2707354 RepID=A0A4R8RKJ7_COLTR|nr:RNA-binding post-transcriptional regulator cip2 [Colletotrichum spinosum]TDZ67327.1 RNA-binding post-transcriptional regulator cip2 [Colletotrichum trifolii]TEA18177.1 RNA-binding post-transcriptional regulator cip2 [Colletotrichum sidae]